MNAEQDYLALLKRDGLEHLLRPPSADSVRRFVEERLTPSERELVGDHVTEIRDAGYGVKYENPFADIGADFLATMAENGIELPGDVHIGEYPHHSFNAQAKRTEHGTLILLNTGLRTLLDRVGIAMGASLRTFTRLEDRSVREAEATEEQELSRLSARNMLAESLVAYISDHETWVPDRPHKPLDERRIFGFLVARSAERFVVGHEFGHLLAGHVHGAWRKDGLDREFEADELSVLLSLRSLDESAGFVQRATAAAGPFLFLALDHLVTRVRDEVYELPDGLVTTTHPPSDMRAAALRRVFHDLADVSELQFADAFVSWLSHLEDDVVATARGLIQLS